MLICLYTVKWFQVLLCITNNSIKHQLFTQLNDWIIVLTIQFKLSYLFAHSLDVKQFHLTHRPYQVLSLRARVNLGAIAMKRYSPFLNQMDLCYFLDTHWRWGSYPSAEIQSVYFTAPANWDLRIWVLVHQWIIIMIPPLWDYNNNEDENISPIRSVYINDNSLSQKFIWTSYQVFAKEKWRFCHWNKKV